MKPVRTIQRYKCDYCNHRTTKNHMFSHEKMCYFNPNRYCPFCDNEGVIDVNTDSDGITITDECIPCKTTNKIILEREKPFLNNLRK